jgi:AcrR family transcriptional regulator
LKTSKNQPLRIRVPRQRRSLQKVELILEATIRLLEKGGLDVVTTNAVAEKAGVSIGTLYQYFASKEAILDALAAREVAALEASVAAVMQTGSMAPQERIAAVVRAVSAGYGRRRQVHRLMMEYSLARGSQRLGPLLEKLIALMTTNKRPGANTSGPLSQADAFVLIHAFVGVMRAMISARGSNAPPREQIEQAVIRLLMQFAGHAIDART